jgi:hypothetical protein
VNLGSRYEFLDDAPVRAQLARIEADAKKFQEESEKLATAFNDAHGGTAAVGAFLLFKLTCSTGRIFALLKFEDEKVLTYDFKKGSGPNKPVPTFGEIERTFVQNRNALQKAALIRLDSNEDDVCLVDRQNPHGPAAYFEQFLRVRRKRTEEELTTAIISATLKTAMKFKDTLPADVTKNLSQRLYNAGRSGASVDGEKAEEWLKSVVGPLPDDSPLLKEFSAELRRQRLAGESFKLDKNAIPAPRVRHVETESGVKVIFPVGLKQSVVSVDSKKGEIIIRDQIKLDDLELITTPRTRS